MMIMHKKPSITKSHRPPALTEQLRSDSMYNVEFTREELDALLIQIGSRIDALRQLQKDEAREENVGRVIEIETFIQPIISGKEKMEKELYK